MMTRTLLLPALLTGWLIAGQPGGRHFGAIPTSSAIAYQQVSRGNYCGASKDLVVQALELIRPDSPRSDLERASLFLQNATVLCSSTADAMYYRALVEEKLGHKTVYEFDMGQARFLKSEAERESLNPFVLSTSTGATYKIARGSGVASGNPSIAPSSAASHKWALVVGLSKFSDPSIDPLNYTLKDATDLAAVLKDPKIGAFDPDYVHLLTDAEATTANIKTELNAIARKAQPQDLVLIYVATHGSPRSLDTVQGVNYLVTYDTQAYKAGKVDEDHLYATAFPMVELANAVSTRMKALRTVVILDTCYSGGAGAPKSAGRLKDAVPSKDMYSHMGLGSGRVIISASSNDEESYESEALAHGYFTYSLIQALKSSKRGTPINQIFDTVYSKVTQLASTSGVAQHPTIYRSSDDTNFPLDETAGVASLRKKAEGPRAGH